MKFSDFTHLGGLKGTQNRLAFMQEGYNEMFTAVAKLCGDKTILHGVEFDGNGNVSDGWIAVNGELVRFIGGTLGTDVVFSTAITSLVFADGSTHDVHYDKTATCGSGGAFPFTDLQPLLSLKHIWKKDDLRMCKKDNAYIAANFDTVTGIGITPEERGWQILSIQDANAAGKTFVNIDSSDPNYDEAGKFGGAKEHTLTQEQLPNVSLKMFESDVNTTGGDTVTSNDGVARSGTGGSNLNYEMRKSSGNGATATLGNTSRMGNDEPHNNMQPSYAILTLIKL
jgi:microcystin-dependent protein